MRALLLAALLAVAAIPVRAADRLTVILDWFVNANHEALLSAQYSGAYARAGLDVRFIVPADPGSPPRLLAAHEADLCVSYQPELSLLDAAGLGLVRVGTLINTPLDVLLVPEGGPVRTLADLKGRRVGASVGATDEALLRAMLGTVGLRPNDVTLTAVNFQIEQALMSGRVDAVIGGMRNYEQIDLRQRGFKAIGFNPEQHGVPPYDELILLARRDNAHDLRIVRFLAALRQGTAALLADPDGMWRAFARDHPEADTPLNRAAWFATLPALDRDPARLDAQRYATFQDFMVKQGTLKAALPVGEIAVQP